MSYYQTVYDHWSSKYRILADSPILRRKIAILAISIISKHMKCMKRYIEISVKAINQLCMVMGCRDIEFWLIQPIFREMGIFSHF